MEFIWVNKSSHCNRSKADVTVGKKKKYEQEHISIIFRNAVFEDFDTGYIRLGFAKDGKRLAFMSCDRENGWKIYKSGATTRYIVVRGQDIIDRLVKFLGDYDMQVSDDNYLYIDRRDVH